MFNFKKTKSKTENKLASVDFYIDSSNKVNVNCEWTYETDHNAELLAELLFKINTGVFAANIVSVLSSEIQQKTENSDFAYKTILAWDRLNRNFKNTNNQPLVRPTSFNNNVRMQQ